MESPDDGFSPLGTEIKIKIDLNKPKTLQECTVASPKFHHQHLGQLEDSITRIFHAALFGAHLATRTPSPQAKPSRRAKQPVQLGLFLEYPLVCTGHCVTVITLLAACQTHAILQNSAVNASSVGSTASMSLSSQRPFKSISSKRLVRSSLNCSACSAWCCCMISVVNCEDWACSCCISLCRRFLSSGFSSSTSAAVILPLCTMDLKNLEAFLPGPREASERVFVLLLLPNSVVRFALASVSGTYMSEADASFDTSTLVDSNEMLSFFISSRKCRTIWEPLAGGDEEGQHLVGVNKCRCVKGCTSRKCHTIWELCRCFFPWTDCTRVYRAIQMLGNALPNFLLWYSISTAYDHPWSTMWDWNYVDTSVQK